MGSGGRVERASAQSAVVKNEPLNAKNEQASSSEFCEETNRRKEFYWDYDDDEPHAKRRDEILKAHPEIKQLMGPTGATKWTVLATVLLQVAIASQIVNYSWTTLFVVAYCVGAFANQSLFLAIHELSHRLGSKSIFRNNIYTLLANLPIAFPYGITFRAYHREHHLYQGHHGMDTDIPTYFEALSISHASKNKFLHASIKALFLFFQVFFYAGRPMIVRPETFNRNRDGWTVANIATIVAFDLALILSTGSIKSFLYLAFSSFFACSIHPIAGHFISEHYVFDDPKYETFSYYGPLNYLTYNVGYHNEHHDFPNIPWTRLKQVRELAPEFYNHLPEVKSWTGILFRFVFDETITPFNRLKRPHNLDEKGNIVLTSWDKAVLNLPKPKADTTEKTSSLPTKSNVASPASAKRGSVKRSNKAE